MLFRSVSVVIWHVPALRGLPERLFDEDGRYGLAVVLVAMAVVLNRGKRRLSLFHQFGILLLAMLTLMPGFGIQYLAWLTPWLATLPWTVVAPYVIASGLFCGGVYNYWSGGLPWYYADAVTMGGWKGLLSLAAFVTWLTVAFALARMATAPIEAPAEVAALESIDINRHI